MGEGADWKLGKGAGVQGRGHDGLDLDGGHGLGRFRTPRWAEQEGRGQNSKLPFKTEARSGFRGQESLWNVFSVRSCLKPGEDDGAVGLGSLDLNVDIIL